MSTKIATERNRRIPLEDPEVVVEDSGVFMDAIINGVPEPTQGTIFARFRRGLAKRMGVGGSSAQLAMAEMKEIVASWSPLDQPAVFDVVKTAMQCVASPQPDNSDIVLASLLLGKPPVVVRGGQQ
ncbi:MAG: hypothetical protein NZ942_03430 [Candidatus Aenigmarchaeota archaeon]|nr:hypothetical protein [Candidatus Aenigmarchaeota archaeon]